MNFLEFVAKFFYFPFIMLIHSEIKKSFFCKTTQYCIDTINIINFVISCLFLGEGKVHVS